MQLAKMIVLSLAVLLVSGCTYSVHPILNEADLTTDVDLTGTWELAIGDAVDSKHRSFSATAFADGAKYEITVDGKEFVAEIGKLGNDRWFQIKQEVETESTGVLTSIPIYHFSKYEIDGDTLRLYQFDDPKIYNQLKKLEMPFILHEPSGGVEFYVLTADTTTLQKLMAENSSTLFRKDPLVFKRTK